MGPPTGAVRPEHPEERFGVAIVRAWRSDDRLLIRVITSQGTERIDHDAAGFATDSIDAALDCVAGFLRELENSWHA